MRAAFPAGEAGGAAGESGLRRRIECRLPRGDERHRGAAEQRHAGGAGFPRAAARRLRRSRGLRGLLPDLFQRPGQAARRDRADAGLVAGRRPARAASHRPGSDRSVPVLLRRRRIVRVRPRANSWSWAASTTCSRRSIWKTPTSATWPGSAAGRCSTSRAAWCITSIAAPSGSGSREDADPGRAQEEFPAVLLEEHSRVAAAGCRTSSSPGPGAVLAVAFRRRAAAARISLALWRAFRAVAAGGALAAARASAGARSTDTEAFRRPLGGYFRDRFAPMEPAPERPARAVRLAVPDLPAGARRRRLHVPDAARDGEAGRSPRGRAARLRRRRRRTTRNCASFCASAEWLVRPGGTAAGDRARCCRTRCASSPTTISSG